MKIKNKTVKLIKPKYERAKTLYYKDSGRKITIDRVESRLMGFGSDSQKLDVIYYHGTKDGTITGTIEYILTDKKPSKKEIKAYNNDKIIETNEERITIAAPIYDIGDTLTCTDYILNEDSLKSFVVRDIEIAIIQRTNDVDNVNVQYWEGTEGEARCGYPQHLLILKDD